MELSPAVAAPAEFVDLAALVGQAYGFAQARRAERTIDGYRSDWRQFDRWCTAAQLRSLPAAPSTVALYLTARAGSLRVATLERHLAAIAAVHRDAGHEAPKSPELAQVWSGIRRRHGTAQAGKAPLLVEDLRHICATLGDRVIDVRDRALLTFGFAGAFRRSELVALDVDDVVTTGDGLVVTLRRSKTDQEGAGRQVGIPYGSNPATCPVRALAAWRTVVGDSGGIIAPASSHRDSAGITRPLFLPIDHGRVTFRRLDDATIAKVVKRHVRRIGLDPTAYGAHSLRAGLCTSAALAGATERSIAATTGHRNMAVLRRYIRPAGLFVDNAAAAVGL